MSEICFISTLNKIYTLCVFFLINYRTFTCNMRAFGLSKELCLEFLRKQSVIANLREGECINYYVLNMLKELL